MFPIESFQQTLSKLTSILESMSVRYHVTGGLTGTAYGEPRMTQDIDIVIDPQRIQSLVDPLIERLKASEFYFSEQTIRAEISRGGMFQLLDKAESLKLDVYPRELIPGELSRSVRIEFFPGVFIPAVSRVDAAGSKLIWISKGSHKSRRDFRSIYRNANAAERAAIQSLAKDLELGQLATAVLTEPEELQ